MCTENVSNFLWCTCSANIVVWSISKHCLLKSANLFSAASQAALPSGERSKQSTTFTFSYASFTSFTAKRSSVSNELSPSGAGWPCCGGAEAGRSTRTIILNTGSEFWKLYLVTLSILPSALCTLHALLLPLVAQFAVGASKSFHWWSTEPVGVKDVLKVFHFTISSWAVTDSVCSIFDSLTILLRYLGGDRSQSWCSN